MKYFGTIWIIYAYRFYTFKLKNINAINDIATSHEARIKKVLCANDEAAGNITQIAVSHLKAKNR
ncbi:hypothetical protein [Segatella paludivivens]|uniref:hypothetical protein n=1 Tax=Segatella paludivivens TaxID=185294 RepID=UPI000364F66E|nr:hypothetical protein [Segatella paludivivens]